MSSKGRSKIFKEGNYRMMALDHGSRPEIGFQIFHRDPEPQIRFTSSVDLKGFYSVIHSLFSSWS